MFKVECLGCQAPYQVDERRVPEKGLKMRCPKCGTSFKVEPPVQSVPQTEAAATPPSEVTALPAPVQKAFTSGGVDPARQLGKRAGAGRDPMSRTMIGVSAADLDLLKKISGSDAAKTKGFSVPRPEAPTADIATPVPSSSAVGVDTPAPFAPEPRAPESPPTAQSFGFVASTQQGRDEASLPAVVGERRRSPKLFDVAETQAVLPSAAPSGAPDWLSPVAASDAPPESPVEPDAPLRLSELPQPFAAAARTTPPERKAAAREAASAGASLELDFGADLPIVAAPVPRPPPRRARPLQADAKPSPDDAQDLPARLSDLQVDLPTVGASPPMASARRATAPQRASSLDELGLPALATRGPNSIGLPAPVTPTANRSAPLGGASVPQRREASSGSPGADLPSVGRGTPGLKLPPKASAVSDLPSLFAGDLPDVFADGLPAVFGGGLPEVASVGLPDVPAASLPEVVGAALPAVLAAGLPTVSQVGLPEVSARGVVGFGRVDLPVAREAGLPEVRTASSALVEMDLPGVGESLPSLAYGGSWDEGNLPLVGESLPTAKSSGVPPTHREGALRPSFADGLPSGSPAAFGDFGPDADGDPFAGSEADFGSISEAVDPFATGDTDAAFGAADGEFARASPDADRGASGVGQTADAGYGEVDIGAEAPRSDAPLETADDMEFQAIPQRTSVGPGRAAAFAAVHDGLDADATGSTLELGPRAKAPRVRTRRMALVVSICGAVVGGGALALQPALGPFGIHFIVDQVKRGEHEQRLTELIIKGRLERDRDTLDAARSLLASLEAARPAAPRFEPLQARFAFAHYDAALRFGPLPNVEAAAKTALELLDPESSAIGHQLARAASLAASRNPEATRALEALGPDIDARLLLGEVALRMADWPAASNVWTELSTTQPDNPRVAFGLARALLGLGQPEAARAQATRTLELNPEHVGAPILMLEAHRGLQNASDKAAPDTSGAEELLSLVLRVLPRASPGEAALAHSVLGELHLSQGRTGPAQQAFEEALAIDRNLPRALIGLGETLHLAGRHSEALARFEAAARAEPSALNANLGVAKSQIQLARLPEAKAILSALAEAHKGSPEVIFWTGKAEQALGAHDAAMLAYRSAIVAGQGRADSVEAYLALAKLQAELGQLAAAQQTLSEARAKLPPGGPLHRALGEVAMTRAEYADAYGHFQKALALDPGDTRAHFMAAVALTRLGHFDQALAAFRSVGETDKDFPGLAVERGRLFEESGRNEEALKEYEAAFVKSPNDPDVQIRVGCGRVVAGRGADAEALLENVLKTRPRSAEAYYCLGRALFDQERHVDAITRFDRALSLDSTRAVYHLYLGWVAAEVGRHGEAETALDKALELDKGLAEAYWQRGRLRLKQGAIKDAIRDLEHAVKLKPSRYEALADLAVAYTDDGRISRALATWDAAIAKDADNPTWNFRYGKVLSAAGNGAQAAAHLKRAVDLVAEARAALGSEKQKPPNWLWQAHYLLGRELGLVAAAIPHWQAYLRLSSSDDPYRPEAERALVSLGQPWDRRQ